VFRGSTIGQLVKMLETEYTANLSTLKRSEYNEDTIKRFREYVRNCDRALADRKIAPSQADKVLSCKMLVEKELEWYVKKRGH
jgi:hypothetical protein